MSEFHFDEPKHGHRLPHDRLKGLSNGVGRMCPVSLTGSVLRAAVTSTSALIAIVHNYGPVESGVTLPFGCAAEVANHMARA